MPKTTQNALTDHIGQLSVSAEDYVLEPKPPSSLLFAALPPLGWNRLPLECLEIIVETLDDDTSTLAALLQVNRQCFFLVVPRLYRDPFQRIRDLSTRNSNGIRQSANENKIRSSRIDAKAPPTNPTSDLRLRNRARFNLDMEDIDTIFMDRLQAREHALLNTLLSTVVQDLCVRFPDASMHFFPRLHDVAAATKTASTKKSLFDFGPYFRQVTWPNECYLRNLVVLDLEKLCTRSPRKKGLANTSWKWNEQFERDLLATTGKGAIFQRMYAPPWWEKKLTVIGILDYLQRGILNKPGADRIQSLRIPMHRMRTFLRRHERAPVLQSKSSSTDDIVQPEGSRVAEQPLEEEIESTTLKGVNENPHDANSYIPEDRNTPPQNSDESERPYCFTFNKLTNLHRLEVCYMTENKCDWETLDRVLCTIQCGNHIGKSDDAIQRTGVRQLNQIRELSIQTQSALEVGFTKILNYFEHLEVLELQSNCYQYRQWFWHWDPKLCCNIKALRMGTSMMYREHAATFEDLGRFINLEELRIVVNNPRQFQWVIDAKRNALPRRQPTGLEIIQPALSCRGDVDVQSNHCLPKLKRLGVSITGENPIASLNSLTEAFGNQLEEFIFRMSYSSESATFVHSLPCLTKLAIRGDVLIRFDYASLVQQCPMLELLALQHTYYTRSEPNFADDQAIVDALVKLTNLRCLFLEGIWYLNDDHLLQLAQESQALYKIGIYLCDNLTLEGTEKADTILSNRKAKYPLKRRGVYRLPKTMSDFIAKEFLRRLAYFGHEDD
ncbi:hypothetical protein BGZ58_006814 [Dissophora ornata]|nr:hypothetical protein BGZ58_006814 [Dissophora ornata]